MTLSPRTVKDNLATVRHVGSDVLNALLGAPAPGTANGGFSSGELVGQAGLDVLDRTLPPNSNVPPLFLCQVSDPNHTHSWQYSVATKGWNPISPIGYSH